MKVFLRSVHFLILPEITGAEDFIFPINSTQLSGQDGSEVRGLGRVCPSRVLAGLRTIGIVTVTHTTHLINKPTGCRLHIHQIIQIDKELEARIAQSIFNKNIAAYTHILVVPGRERCPRCFHYAKRKF